MYREATFERRTTPRFVTWRLSTLVFLLSFVLIALSGGSLFYVGRIASTEADLQARANDLRLFDNALRDRQSLMAREQLGLARWTKSFRNIALSFNMAYIRTEIVDTLWNDFEHNRSFLVAGGDRLVMSAREDNAEFAQRTLTAGDPVHEAAQRSIARFMRQREPMKDGFRPKHVRAAKAAEIAEFFFATLDGEPALLSAMAIAPDEEHGLAMADGPPVILVSAKFIRGAFGEELNAQLAFRSFRFEPPGAIGRQGSMFPLAAFDGTPLGVFVWEGTTPGARIWQVIATLIAMIGSALAASALLIARGIGRIATRLETSEARNRKLALHDALTGLANRLHFQTALDAAVRGLPHAPFALIACDLDRFKAVNDTHGHAGGDTVIRAVAARLSAAVGDAGLVGRVGGDEFVVLVDAFCDRPRLTILSRQLIATVCEPITLENGAVTDVGVSIGIAIAPASGATAEGILAAADGALYRAKESGRGVAMFAESAPKRAACAIAPEEGVATTGDRAVADAA